MTSHSDPYRGAEDLIFSLKAESERVTEKMVTATEEGDELSVNYYAGCLYGFRRAIKGIEVYVLLTEKFQ